MVEVWFATGSWTRTWWLNATSIIYEEISTYALLHASLRFLGDISAHIKTIEYNWSSSLQRIVVSRFTAWDLQCLHVFALKAPSLMKMYSVEALKCSSGGLHAVHSSSMKASTSRPLLKEGGPELTCSPSSLFYTADSDLHS